MTERLTGRDITFLSSSPYRQLYSVAPHEREVTGLEFGPVKREKRHSTSVDDKPLHPIPHHVKSSFVWHGRVGLDRLKMGSIPPRWSAVWAAQAGWPLGLATMSCNTPNQDSTSPALLVLASVAGRSGQHTGVPQTSAGGQDPLQPVAIGQWLAVFAAILHPIAR
jgi:hypothetical protein